MLHSSNAKIVLHLKREDCCPQLCTWTVSAAPQSTAAAMAGRSTDRVLEKMRANLEKGAFYEAQQMLKTVYYRYRSRRLYQESYNVVEDGACLQMRQGQVQQSLLSRTSAVECQAVKFCPKVFALNQPHLLPVSV